MAVGFHVEIMFVDGILFGPVGGDGILQDSALVSRQHSHVKK